MLRGRRRALGLLAIIMIGGSAALAAGAQAQLRTVPLLPLARGQLLVSLGDPPQWLPVAGRPLTLTLFSGRPRVAHAATVNAYIALQSTHRRCAATAARDHAHLIELPDYYASRDLLAREQSLFAPGGGGQAGDYAAQQSGTVITQSGAVRACIWLATKPTGRTLAGVQVIPLLGGLFAASVSALPSAEPAAGTGATGDYTLDAIDVGRTFRYSVATTQCGRRYVDPAQSVTDGTLATESIAVGPDPCPGDGSIFSFTRSAGGLLGTLTYTVAQATAAPPEVSTVGGCELEPVAVTPLVNASQYVQAVGCSVAELQIAPFQSGIARGAVLQADVDGGLAEIAPRGTAVDLVLNGRP